MDMEKRAGELPVVATTFTVKLQDTELFTLSIYISYFTLKLHV